MSKLHDLTFTIVAADVDRDVHSYQIEATAEQRAMLVDRFALIRLDHLSADVRVWDGGREEGIHVEGTLRATLAQRCVATLAEVPEEIEGPFELILVDAETADRMDADEAYLDPEIPDYDAIEGSDIALGEIVAQTLSISMNPYPRADGAELKGTKDGSLTIDAPELEKPNPFAVLQKLRDES